MKFRFLVLLIIAGLSSVALGDELKVIKPQKAPVSSDARLSRQLAAHKGQPLLINFWATWCEPCREEMPSLQRLAARLKEQGLVVLTVAVADNPQRVDDFLWEVLPDKAVLPVLHDRERVISRAWGVNMLPTTLLLNRQHRIIARARGPIEWDAPAIDTQLQTLLH